MTNKIKITVLLLIQALITFAQGPGVSVQPLPYQEIHARNDRPLPYQYVREADIMWSKIIWRKLVLNEKMNHFLALPQKPFNGISSLIDVLLDGIHTKGLTAYEPQMYLGNEFDKIMTEDEIHKAMGAGVRKQVVEKTEGVYDTVLINLEYNSSEVKEYLIKEIWFFDKQRSVLDVRIIGLCPVRVYQSLDTTKKELQRKRVFWINYNEARPILAQAPIYNPYTDVRNLTYDDIFQMRLFSSYIIMESNPYGREISQYETGLEVLLEAERIKNEIFNFEQDLWEY